jgi:hypothetical protein
VVALALAASASLSLAQNTSSTNTFDNEASITSLVHWWGVTTTRTWDGTLDAGYDPMSGSLRVEVPYTEAANEQFMIHYTIANRWGWDDGYTLDATTYTNLSFDVKVDPASYVTTGGQNYGNLQVGLTTQANWDNRINPPTKTLPLTATNWTHFDIPVNPAWNFLNEVVGFYIYMWSGDAHTNTLTFNIDNIMLTKPTVPVVIPPPTVSLVKPIRGIAFVAASPGQWDRQNIRTVGNNYNWIGASGPVSYSVTVAKHADMAGFQLHTYLVPGPVAPTRADSDWAEPNVLMWRIFKNADGSARSEVHCKTNAPESNGTMFTARDQGGGTMGGMADASPVGTWTLTFNQTTNFTITAPSGATFTTNIPNEYIDVWRPTPEMQISVGCVPADPVRVGQMATVTGVKITGTAGGNVDSSFEGVPLDTNIWSIVAASPTWGVQQIGTDAAYWVNWTLPATGFALQKSTSLSGPWVDGGLTGYAAGGMYYNLCLKSNLPSSDAGYFRLMKRTFTKLQVLLPGETAAPGTPTGKTGTPTPQPAYTPFDIVVNAVDNDWYPIPGVSHVIHLTSDDLSFIGPAADPGLVNGTVTIQGSYFGTVGGPFTITATDVTDPAKTPGVSSPVQVQ